MSHAECSCVVRAGDTPITQVGDAQIRWVVNHASGGAKELTVGLFRFFIYIN